jgi:glucose-1-phosphate thymidylyltransferase
MKGVVLAGGIGSRLHPLTRVTNKHLLPVYNQPMVFYPIQTLVNIGLSDIIIVYQEGEGGIADALRLAEHFTSGEPICVVLGDNIIENNICAAADIFRQQERGAHILLKKVDDPERFGCPEILGERIVRIEEKPKRPKSPYAVTGVYFYDNTVFKKIRRLKPSNRGELEITDINNMYLDEGTLTHSILDGWWTDAGTFASLQRATNLVAETGANKMPQRTKPLANRRSTKQAVSAGATEINWSENP